MHLYEINAEIESAIEAMMANADPETGEVRQEDLDKLGELQIARGEKLEAIGCVIKNKKAEAKAIKEEADALTKRRKSIEREVDGLEKYVSMMLKGEPFESAKVRFSYKDAIKDAIKAGKKVRFAHIEKKQNLQIK